MRKGDEKRLQLLNDAEKLFCLRGYDKTSVQDIIAAAGLSKGGFYHHFDSKDEVLKALCQRRAERAAAFTAEALDAVDASMERINAVLQGFIPLRKEEAGFLTMLLPVIAKPEGRAVAMIYQDALESHFLPLLRKEVAAASDTVFPPVKDVESIVLNTVNHCWMGVAALLYTALREGRRPDTTVFLATLERYRRAVEVLLDAPYGSIEILRVEALEEVTRAIG
jgi:AcrR family transcriptional regulator